MASLNRARRNTKAKLSGFSLVELAIVLIIIGLIVGGVLKGQDLVESARVNSIQTQLNEIRVASSTFLNKYDDLPGDIADVTVVSSDTNLKSGNGNGRIEGARMDAKQADSEAVGFWQQLRAANLLGGITDNAAANMAVANGLASKVGGIYTITNETRFGSQAHWINLGRGTGVDGGVVSPTQMRGIDKKSDDGRPTSGNIGAANGTSGGAAQTCITSGAYAVADAVGCVPFFKL